MHNFVAIINTKKAMNNKIGIACDHAGYQLKELLTGYLSAKGFEILDFGCNSEESCDYADFAHLVTYEQFIALNGQYLNILMGRGVLNMADLELLISMYLK